MISPASGAVQGAEDGELVERQVVGGPLQPQPATEPHDPQPQRAGQRGAGDVVGIGVQDVVGGGRGHFVSLTC